MSRVDELREQYRTLTKQQTTPKTSDKSVDALKVQYRNLTQPKQQTQPVAQQPVVQQPVQPKNNGILTSAGLSGLRAMDNRPAETIPVQQPVQQPVTPATRTKLTNNSNSLLDTLNSKVKANMPSLQEYTKVGDQARSEAKQELEGKEIRGRDLKTYEDAYNKAMDENNAYDLVKYGTLKREAQKQFEQNIKDNKYTPDLNFIAQQRKITELTADLERRKQMIGSADSLDIQSQVKAAKDYQDKLNELNEAIAKYNDNVEYDKVANNGMATDIAKSFGLNVAGGMANTINGWTTTGSKLSGFDTTTINANALYDYMHQPQEESDNPYALLGNVLREGASYVGTRVMPGGAALNEALGGGIETPNVAFGRLEDLHKMYPNNPDLTNLYNAISSGGYEGTAEDLKNDLDRVQQSLYTQFKNTYTQDDLDRVQNQSIHNEQAYGGMSFVPNAFGVVGNMTPSILIGVATGGLGEAAGAGSALQQAGSMSSIYQSAKDAAMNRALNEGANYSQAYDYGVASGLTEAGTEMIGGEAVNRALGMTGKSALSKLFGKGIERLGIKSKVGKAIAGLASGVAGEATEEMISEALDPVWRGITYDKEALPDNPEKLGQYFKDILMAGVEAIPSTLLMEGGGNVINNVRNNALIRTENGLIKSIENSDFNPEMKQTLVNEVQKAATEVETSQATQQAGVTAANSIANKVKALETEQKLTLPESTQNLLQFLQDTRPGLNIEFDSTIQGNGTHSTNNADGSRTITINPKSSNPVEVIVTHELAHDLKAGDVNAYTDLQQEVLKYAEKLPKYKEALQSLDQTYKEGKVNYTLSDEATNDILAEAIGNQEFLNSLAQEKPNLFERIYNWFRNVLFDGEKTGLTLDQRRILNKMEQGFRNAYQSAYKGTGSNQVQNSLNENDRTLAATHNLTEEKLRGVLELGGFPVPSIAISDVNKLTPTQFGDITVLFDKETINPANKKNEVYNRDVWSPTFPEIGYNINNAEIRKMMDENNIQFDSKDDLMQKAENRFFDADNLKHFIGYSAPYNAIADMKHNKYLKYVYAKTQQGLEPTYKTRNVSYNFSNDVLQKFNDYAGNYDVNSDETVDKYQDKIIDFLIEEALEEDDIQKLDAHAKEVYKNMIEKSYRNNYSKLRDFVYDAFRLKRAINEGNMTQADENATLDKVEKNIKQEDFEKWIDNTFGNLISQTEKGIRNNKDAITDTGRRTFKQLHDKYTLANVVKAMTKSRTVGGENTIFAGGWGKTQAHLAKKFRNIEDIRTSKNQLKTNEEISKAVKPLQEKFDNDYLKLANYQKNSGEIGAADDTRIAVEDFAEKYSNQLTIDNFKKVLDSNPYAFDSTKIPEKVLQPIIDDLEAMKDIPTDYFEAKPQRAVGFEEIASVLIPSDLAEDTKQQLRDRGIKFTEYDRNIEGDREAKYREAAQDVLFSKSNGQWQQFVQDNFNLTNGTRANFLPTTEELQQQEQETKAKETEKIARNVEALNMQEEEKEEQPVTLVQSEDNTLFSLAEDVENYIDELNDDSTIPFEVKNELLERFNSINSYEQLNELKQAVKDYKDLAYGSLTNARKKQVDNFMKDYKTARGTLGQTMDKKAVKETITNNVGNEPGNTRTIQNTIKAINQDMFNGELTDNKIQEYVDNLGKTLKSTISDYYDMYKGLKDTLKTQKIYVPENIKRGITDYNDFRKSNMGTLKLTSDSSNMSVDQVWQELRETYPEMLPEKIVNPIDQLEYLSDLAKGIKKEQGSLEDIMYKQYGEEAWDWTSKKLKQDLIDLRDSQANAPEETAETEDNKSNEKNLKWIQTAQTNPLIKEFIEKKDKAYIPDSNKKQLAYANKQLAQMGYENAKNYIDTKVKQNERITANDMALSQRLIQEAIKQGKYEEAQELIADTAILSKDYGQVIQATSMISRLTPEGQLMYLNKVVDKLNNKIDQKNLKKAEDKQTPNITLDKELQTNILKAEDDIELEQAIDAALQRIADQMEVSLSDKIAEWRYFAMLANPRTHARNFLANVAMRGTYETKNLLQRILESIASPVLDERTRTFKKATEDVKKFAEQSMKDNAATLSGNKERGIESRLKEMQKVFKKAPLEKLRRINSNLLSLEDNIFTNNAYKTNLQEYLTANGIKTQHDIDTNFEIVQKGINFAIKEAQKTTFHQMSKLASELNRMENISGLSKLVVGGIVPFKKTPINIAKTGAAYSPLGLLETITNETYQLKKGNITANEWIDRLSQGLTGTALMGLGYFLSKAGILKGAADKDESYAEDIGQTKSYSVRIGNKNYDISWLAPSGIPLLMGAELNEATKGKDATLGEILEVLGKAVDPISEMSLLQGVGNALKSYSNSNSTVDYISTIVGNAASSYFGQFLPTLGGQFNKIIDDTERNTTATKASEWKKGESFARQQLNKVPFGSFLLEPKTDVWGNEKKRDSNPLVRAFDALINPGNVTEDRTTEVDKEIMSLIDAVDDKSLAPSIPSNNFKYDGEEIDLSSKDYTKFKKTYGQFMYNNYEDLLNNDYYKKLEPEKKAKVISNIQSLAKDVAKNEVGYETNAYFKFDVIKDELDKANIPLIDYFLIGRDITSSSGKGKRQTIIAQEVEAMNEANEKISNDQKKVIRDIFGLS